MTHKDSNKDWTVTDFKLPLMENNITESDLNDLAEFIKSNPKLTNGPKVEAFESAWSEWLGVKHSVFVNSGSSANLLTMAALKWTRGTGEVLVPTLTWSSDISSIIHSGHEPKFVDCNLTNLSMDTEKTLEMITKDTKAVFLTHILGFNGLSEELLAKCSDMNIPIIEDVCESHGATFNDRKLGSLGWISNFSFYYAHHMSTIEGGMICTNDSEVYEILRCLRSHGMVREAKSTEFLENYKSKYPDLNPEFIFAYPAYNVRSTEINAHLGLKQLQRLDENNRKRVENFDLFLKHINSDIFYTDFETKGSVNYAFLLILRDKDKELRDTLERGLKENNIEFRRGTSGGGNQIRQPYVKETYKNLDPNDFPNTEHLHFYGYYIGNYPTLDKERILELCRRINKIVEGH